VWGFFREIHWRISSSNKNVAELKLIEAEKQSSPKRKHRKLVRRSHFMTIIAAWVITVPAAAILSGFIFIGLVNLFA